MLGRNWAWLALAWCACDGAGAASEDAERSATVAATPEIDPSPRTVLSPDSDLDALAWVDRLELERAIAADDPRFSPRLDETGPLLGIEGSAVASFSSSGTHLALSGRDATLALAAMGREGVPAPLNASRFEMAGPELRSGRAPGVVEWWRSLPSGLEHGVNIATRPSGEGALTLEMAVGGELSVRTESETSVAMLDASNQVVARYAELLVLDADGATVPARMSASRGTIRIEIDDAQARYPLVVDPLVVVSEMQLTPSVSGMDTFYGLATAISGDGTRAIVGSVDGASVGRVFIYLRTGATWTQERVINAPMTAADCRFGQSVALSRNGAVAIVGAPNCLSGTSSSAAFIYARTGTTWALDQRLPSPEREFGDAVAITADGTRALIGAPLGGPMVRGEAYVFLRGATTWALESSLPPAADAGNDGYGGSVALAADGTRAVVGMPRHDLDGNNDVGSAHFFVRSGTTWTREADIPAPVGFRSDFNEFGRSVAMSSDGTRTLIGSGSGGWVYLRGTGGWAFEAQLADAAGDSGLGTAVALSSNGNRALLGGLVGTFGADIFVRSGTTWALGGRLIDPAVTSDAAHGSALSISDNGARAIVGAPNTDVVFRNDGTAFVYTIALAPAGTSCTSNAVCASGFCTDGVCCNNACNGTCRACVSAETGIADGTCAPLSAALAPTITCRPSAGVCDVAEICSASSETCPTDDFVPSSMVCNASTGEPCDVAEFCTGTSAACPTDVAAPMGTVCRAAAPTSCDAPEVCNGTAKTCPTDVNLPEGAVCRPVVSGGCDVAAETCSGTSSVCPPDSFAPAATVCRPAVSGGCDLAERCTGTSNACPADAIVPAGTSCRPEVAGGCDVAEVCNGTNTCPTDVVRAGGTMCRAAAAGGCDVPETCNGSAPTCPVNTFAPNTRICRMAAAGGCDVPESCTGTGAACPTNRFAPATLVCRGAADVCDVPESCTGTAAACPSDILAPSTTTCRAAVPGGCDVPETCSGTAIACPPDVFQPNTTVCRTVSGDCDVAESCTGASNACPIDGFLPASSICREAAGACDAREVCDGGGPTCPGDLRVPMGTPCGGTGLGSCSSPGVCNGSSVSCPGSSPRPAGTVCVPRVAGNPCDLDDVCDGASDACVARFADATAPCGSPVSGVCDAPDHCAGPTSATCIVEFLSGDVCRPSTGVCDPADLCTGGSVDCPADVPAPMGTLCRPADGLCDRIETCTGTSTVCPGDVFAAFGTECRPPVDGTCDLAETCVGTADCPPDRFAPATTQCGVSSGEDCDADDFCAGTSAECVDAFLSGVECRAAAGACDTREVCSGSSASCPPDGFLASGVVCRASDLTCDPAESCDGLASACPADVNSCVATDAGPEADSGPSPDAGPPPPPPTTGCACALGPAPSTPRGPLLAFLGLALALGARRRRA